VLLAEVTPRVVHFDLFTAGKASELGRFHMFKDRAHSFFVLLAVRPVARAVFLYA
jgi:hypothetical protein